MKTKQQKNNIHYEAIAQISFCKANDFEFSGI